MLVEIVDDVYRRKVFRYSKGRCLEVGCGSGKIIDYVARKIPDEQHMAIDVVNCATDLKAPNVKFIKVSVEDFNPKTKFDTIIMLHVLEHLENPIGVLKKLYDILNKGGKIIIAVPNRFCIPIEDPKKTLCEEYSPHLWLWDKGSLDFTLTKSGFKHFFIPFMVHVPLTRSIARLHPKLFEIVSHVQEILGSTLGRLFPFLQWHLIAIIEG